MGSNDMTDQVATVARRAGLVAACLAISACGNLLDARRPAVDAYWLAPLERGSQLGTELLPTSLRLRVVPGLDTNRILTLDDQARLGHISGSTWADNLPEVLTSVLIRSLSMAGLAVVDTAGSARAGCRLDLEVREFFARLDSAGQPDEARAAVAGSLVCDGAPLRELEASATASVAGQSAAAVSAAFQSALDQLTRKLIAQMDA